jgi:hypothetical protein
MNYNQQAPLQNQADEMAKYGRYGDTMLVHMNPYEVEGIASLSPTGKLTTNPVTGQPEAFLPFLAPLLGSMIGKAALAKAGGLLAGKTALAGAIGSGLATTAVTGDIKKGLLSGITGFGLGKALGGASEALSPEVATAAENVSALESQIAGGADAIREATTTLGGLTKGTPEYLAQADKLANLQAAQSTLTGAMDTGSGLITPLESAQQSLIDAQTLARQSTGSLFRESPLEFTKQFGKELIKPANLAAIGVGEGKKAEMDALEDAMERNRRFEEEREEEGRRAEAMIEDAYSTLEASYPGYQIPRGISAGGIVSLDPNRAQRTVDGVYSLAAGGGVPLSEQTQQMQMVPTPSENLMRGRQRSTYSERVKIDDNPDAPYYIIEGFERSPNINRGIYRGRMPEELRELLKARSELTLEGKRFLDAQSKEGESLQDTMTSIEMLREFDKNPELSARGLLISKPPKRPSTNPEDRNFDSFMGEGRAMMEEAQRLEAFKAYLDDLERRKEMEANRSAMSYLPSDGGMSSGGEVAGYRMGRKIKKEAQEQANAIADQVAFDTAMGNINLGSYGNFGVSGGPAGRPGAAARQLGLRGTQVITPSELEGYRPGIDPEIAYFRDPLPEPKADTTAGTGGTRADAGQLGSDLYNAIFGSGRGTGVAAPVIDPFSGKMPSEMAMEGIGAEPSMMISGMEGAGIPSIGAAARAEATPMPDTKPLTPKEIRMGRGMEGDIAIPEITIPQTINIPSVPAAAVVPPVVPAAIAPISTPPAVSVGRPDVMDLPPPPPMQTKRNTEEMVGIPMAPIRPSSIRIPDIPALQEPMIPIGVKTLDREESPNIPPPPAPVVRPPRPTMTLAEAARPRTDQPIDLTNVNTAGAANISDIGGFFGQAESGISQLPPIATPPVMSPIQMPREEMALPPIPEGKQVLGGLADLIRSAGVPKPVDTPIIPSEVPPLLAPKDRERIRIPRFAGPPGFQEGGEVTAMADTMEANGQSVIQDAAMAIAGRLPEEQAEMAINRFIEEFGVEAFEVLRDRVLKDIVPDAQTEGEIVGRGGGMDDMIPGMIGDQQPVAVSPGEYIVPADVVSGLGDGSTDAGVEELDQMLDRVRMERTGMTQQPRPMNTGGALPA